MTFKELYQKRFGQELDNYTERHITVQEIMGDEYNSWDWSDSVKIAETVNILDDLIGEEYTNYIFKNPINIEQLEIILNIKINRNELMTSYQMYDGYMDAKIIVDDKLIITIEVNEDGDIQQIVGYDIY